MNTREQIRILREEGKTFSQISAQLNISKSVISYHCKKLFGEIPKAKYFCSCGKQKDKRSKVCIECKKERDKEKIKISEDSTLGDKTYTKHKYAKYSYIRFHARKKIEEMGITCCMHCGYSKHIEVAHIKSISSFSPETTISQINTKENLLALCPNCHWEFDFGDLSIEEILPPRIELGMTV